MSAQVTLSQLADLALGSPEVGAVNFNVLNTLLHSMLNHMGISNVKASIPEEDKTYIERRKSEVQEEKDSDDEKAKDHPERAKSESPTETATIKDSKPYAKTVKSTPVPKSQPLQQLEDKVNSLEKKLKALNELPSTAELMEKSMDKPTGTPVAEAKPVANMWQNMVLKNKVDSHDKGIDKVV